MRAELLLLSFSLTGCAVSPPEARGTSAVLEARAMEDVALEHADASEVADAVRRLVASKDRRGTTSCVLHRTGDVAARPSVVLQVDAAGNALRLYGAPADLRSIRLIVSRLDVAPEIR